MYIVLCHTPQRSSEVSSSKTHPVQTKWQDFLPLNTQDLKGHTLFGGETPFRSMKEVPPLQSSEILNRSVNLINCRAFICRLGLAV